MAYGVIGLSPDVLWNMTYYEFCLACKGYEQRLRQGLSESWWTANLNMAAYHNPKKFPALSKLLDPPRELATTERDDVRSWLATLPKKKKLRNN